MILKVTKTTGSGRPLLILYEIGQFIHLTNEIIQMYAKERKCIAMKFQPFDELVHWHQACNELRNVLTEENVRQANIISFGSLCGIGQWLALEDSRAVRNIVMIDPEWNIQSGLFPGFVSKIENLIPLGLPLRNRRAVFDSRSFFHRVRCPVLILKTRDLSKNDNTFLWNNFVNRFDVHAEPDAGSLFSAIELFNQIPSRRPQKQRVQ